MKHNQMRITIVVVVVAYKEDGLELGLRGMELILVNSEEKG